MKFFGQCIKKIILSLVLVFLSPSMVKEIDSSDKYTYNPSSLGAFSNCPQDIMETIVNLITDPQDQRYFLSVCRELSNYGIHLHNLYVDPQFHFDWYGLSFENQQDKLDFNKAIVRFLKKFEALPNDMYAYDCHVEWFHRGQKPIPKGNKIQDCDNEHLKLICREAELGAQARYILKLVDKAHENDMKKKKGMEIIKSWFDKEHPLALLFSWFVEYDRLNSLKKKYSVMEDEAEIHLVYKDFPKESKLLLQYSTVIQELFALKDPACATIYGLHTYLFLQRRKITNYCQIRFDKTEKDESFMPIILSRATLSYYPDFYLQKLKKVAAEWREIIEQSPELNSYLVKRWNDHPYAKRLRGTYGEYHWAGDTPNCLFLGHYSLLSSYIFDPESEAFMRKLHEYKGKKRPILK